LKLLRTIRLDTSDTFVFERAAEPGEWAVPGAFMFSHQEVQGLEGKQRAAFRSGFVGIETFGWSTLTQVAEVAEADRVRAVEILARQLVIHFGAPDLMAAKVAAEEEIAFAASLSDHPNGMLVALSRQYEDGSIRETFRTLTPAVGLAPARAYAFLEVAGEEEEATDQVDLRTLGKEAAGG
jgi:hypothetical protein